jgi:hypothetical protein
MRLSWKSGGQCVRVPFKVLPQHLLLKTPEHCFCKRTTEMNITLSAQAEARVDL